MNNDIIKTIEKMKQEAINGNLDMQLLKDYFLDLETLIDEEGGMRTPEELKEGDKVYCKTTQEEVYIKEIGEISCFCVKDLNDKIGFYYDKYELNKC